MRKHLLLISAIALCLNSYAQNINIPDHNFKAKLIDLNIDSNQDGEISITEAQAVTSLNIAYCMAETLKGIEAFTNLTYLNCRYAGIDTLDLSENVLLETLLCRSNHSNTTFVGIRSINVSKNINLKYLECDVNDLTTLDLSHNTKLETLICGANEFPTLDLTHNTALKNLDCSYTIMTSLDLSQNTSLQRFTCTTSNLKNIDLSRNTQLTFYSGEFNSFTELDFSKNLLLDSLNIGSNALNELDLSQNTNLKYIYFGKVNKPLSVCVWEIPFPPSGVEVVNFGTVVTFSDCVTDIALQSRLTSIYFYINPISNLTTLMLPDESFYSLSLTDMQGRIVKDVYNISGKSIEINSNDIGSGLYFYTLANKNDGSIYKGKVILK